jgi:hypothetical protein
VDDLLRSAWNVLDSFKQVYPNSWYEDVSFKGDGMKHDKTFEAIKKLKDIEIELHRLKNALELANKSLDSQRPWVGLTDEEIKEIIGPWGDTPIKGYTRKLFDQIETKLKEKNT